MIIKIEATPEEIAALVIAIQGQRNEVHEIGSIASEVAGLTRKSIDDTLRACQGNMPGSSIEKIAEGIRCKKEDIQFALDKTRRYKASQKR